MYNIVKQWEWGNSNSKNIYHDPETRKNSISYRSNMARLAEELINKDQFEKAEEILDLAMEKMPIDFFGYYSLLYPIIDSYYRIKKVGKAREILEKVMHKHKLKLAYFNSLSDFLKIDLAEEILTEVERFRSLIETSLKNKDKEKMADYIKAFQKSSIDFSFLYGKYDFYTSQEEFIEGFYLSGDTLNARKLVDEISLVYEERLKLISNFDSTRQIELEERIMDEVNGYRRILFYTNIYDDKDRGEILEERIYNSIKDLEVFENLIKI